MTQGLSVLLGELRTEFLTDARAECAALIDSSLDRRRTGRAMRHWEYAAEALGLPEVSRGARQLQALLLIGESVPDRILRRYLTQMACLLQYHAMAAGNESGWVQ